MIEYAGIGIATANAVPRALSAADFVTEDNESEGVVKALEILGLI
jgi:hydroxymethylpyrimidine pyrophosphatase-like HAD family hydrolase